MPGKLDEISYKIGELASSQQSLDRTFVDHCKDDDRRHTENLTELRAIRQDLSDLVAAVKPLSDSVAAMRPIVDGVQITRSKIAGAMAVGAALIAFIGWVGSIVIGKLFSFMMALFVFGKPPHP